MPKSTNDSPWARYEPKPDDPWDLRKVAHLHRRAGFGATRAELLRDVAAGPEASVERLFHPPQLPTEEARGDRRPAPDGADLVEPRPAQGLLAQPHPPRARPAPREADPLLARPLRHQQQEGRVGRAHGPAERDAANPRPRRLRRAPGGDHRRPGHARLARRGNQQEGQAQRELRPRVPRAVHPGRRPLHRARHPRGRPRVHRLGPPGFPAAASRRRRSSTTTPRRSTTAPRRSSARPGAGGPPTSSGSCSSAPRPRPSWRASSTAIFVSEAGTPGPELIEPLADEIKQHEFAIGPIVEVILRSRHFYSRSVYRQRIKSPVEFSAGLVRMLEVPRPAINPLALSAACDAQGQELFAPPNVEGWVGGPLWINSATLLERTNWAADVVWGRAENGLAPFDPAAWAARVQDRTRPRRRGPDRPAAPGRPRRRRPPPRPRRRPRRQPRTACAKPFNASPTAPSSNWPEPPKNQKSQRD